MTRGDRSSTAGLHRPSSDVVRQPPPSRRRPLRAESVTYRVRVELLGCQPPVWRRLELASDLFLDDVHEILQVAFGWTDSHLHRFGCGPKYYSDDTEYYLMEYEVHEGETGIPEEQVRLDEVLVEVGDRSTNGTSMRCSSRSTAHSGTCGARSTSMATCSTFWSSRAETRWPQRSSSADCSRACGRCPG
jgi:Plasmid pRiA4b ORF-3-like protein